MLGADEYVMPPRPHDCRKPEWMKRLAEWESEMETNAHGMQPVAQRCVNVLKDEIAFFWPEST